MDDTLTALKYRLWEEQSFLVPGLPNSVISIVILFCTLGGFPRVHTKAIGNSRFETAKFLPANEKFPEKSRLAQTLEAEHGLAAKKIFSDSLLGPWVRGPPVLQGLQARQLLPVLKYSDLLLSHQLRKLRVFSLPYRTWPENNNIKNKKAQLSLRKTRATRKHAKIAPIRRAYNVVADSSALSSFV